MAEVFRQLPTPRPALNVEAAARVLAREFSYEAEFDDPQQEGMTPYTKDYWMGLTKAVLQAATEA